MSRLDVLIPTFNRPAALAVTLTSLAAQTYVDFRVIVSDQSDDPPSIAAGEVLAAARVLQLHGNPVTLVRHLPRRGVAEHRQCLLDRASSPYVVFLDDDVLLEPWAIETMVSVMREQRCGFAGMAVIGLSYKDDVRPHQQHVEPFSGRVEPERVVPGSPEWERHHLHSAANLLHVQQRLGATPAQPIVYRLAWIGGCVLYETDALRRCGGFEFWRSLPERHCGEDVLAQLRVMAARGGCGIMPSGAYHLEVPTTVVDRSVDAPLAIGVD